MYKITYFDTNMNEKTSFKTNDDKLVKLALLDKNCKVEKINEN